MVSRTCLVQLFLVAMQILWGEEQPSSSLMFLHPRKVFLRFVLRAPPPRILYSLGTWTFIHTWMGAFNAPTAKSSRIAANSPWVAQLHRSLTREQIRYLSLLNPTYVQNIGRATQGLSSITGRPACLKQTQEYTPRFARSIIQAWEQHREAKAPPRAANIPMVFSFQDMWFDADLCCLAQQFGVPHDRLVV